MDIGRDTRSAGSPLGDGSAREAFVGLRFDESEKTIYRGANHVLLGDSAWSLTQVLVVHRGHWCSSRLLATRGLHRQDPAGVTLVWKHISLLRRALEPLRLAIVTNRLRGYRLVEFDDARSSGARSEG